jgi:hypothetical protein
MLARMPENPAGRHHIVNDAETIAALRRHWAYAATDQEITHEIYHADAVLEFPQGRERFEGVANFIAWRRRYPASLEFKLRRIRGSGTFWVVENAIRYDGGPWQNTVNLLEFRDGKVSRETIYIAEDWVAPEWRAPWRAPWADEAAW